MTGFGVWTGVLWVVQTVTVGIRRALFFTATISVNRNTRGCIGAKVGVVLDTVIIVIQLGLCTAVCVHGLPDGAVGTKNVEVVDDTVTVVVLQVNQTAPHAVGSIGHTRFKGTLVSLFTQRIVAKAVTVGVLPLCFDEREGIPGLVFAQS